jgi:hypothetical protein
MILICWLFGHDWYTGPGGRRLQGFISGKEGGDPLREYGRVTAEKKCDRCGKVVDLRWED